MRLRDGFPIAKQFEVERCSGHDEVARMRRQGCSQVSRTGRGLDFRPRIRT